MTQMLTPPRPRRTWKRPVLKALEIWRERHRHSFNFAIHLLGIPLAVAGVVLLFTWEEWYWGAGALVLGYVLQYLGHRVEGNDVGEWAAIKRLLGLPCVSIAPRYQESAISNQQSVFSDKLAADS